MPRIPNSDKLDETALRLVPGGDPKLTLDEVYRRYCRYVAAVILRLDGRAAEVDDLIQDVFVEAAAGIARLRKSEAIKGWLATIAVRTVRRRLRSRRVKFFLGLDRDLGRATVIDPAASPVDRLLLRAVYRVLDEMPVEERLAFTLHTMQGETMEVVARLCECSLATAKRRVSRAQRRIEERMSDV